MHVSCFFIEQNAMQVLIYVLILFMWYVIYTDFLGNFADNENGQCGRLKIDVGNKDMSITRAPCNNPNQGFICEYKGMNMFL